MAPPDQLENMDLQVSQTVVGVGHRQYHGVSGLHLNKDLILDTHYL